MELTTDRLVLRYLSEADIDDITRICQDPEIYQNTLYIPSPYTRADAKNWLDQIFKSRAEDKAGDDFGIHLKADDRFIGVISLGAKNRHDDSEVGYWLDKDYREQGIMTETLREIIAFGFAKGCHRISACHFAGNPKSGRVMEKAGMTREGLHRESLKKNGQYLDDVVYGILERDCQSVKGEPTA